MKHLVRERDQAESDRGCYRWLLMAVVDAVKDSAHVRREVDLARAAELDVPERDRRLRGGR
jgi:hypothetical protein